MAIRGNWLAGSSSLPHRKTWLVDSAGDLSGITPVSAGESVLVLADKVWRTWDGAAWQAPAGAASCYTLPILAANQATTTDGQTIYFGGAAALAPGTTANLAPIYVPKSGTVKAVYLFANAGTAGTNEAWAMQLRLNNTTDTQIASVSANTANRLWSNASMSVAVAAGDRLEIKSVCPTWATNPANVRYGGCVYIES